MFPYVHMPSAFVCDPICVANLYLVANSVKSICVSTCATIYFVYLFISLICQFTVIEKSDCDKMKLMLSVISKHCVKSDRIRSYSGPYLPTFALNTERYFVSLRIQPEYSVFLRIQSEYRKMRTRITPNTDTFTQWKSQS